MDPNQQFSPIQPPGPQAQSPMVSPAAALQTTHDQVQDTMRKSVLKIIAGLSGLSILGVVAIFLFSGASDASLLETRPIETTTANYSVPISWSEDTAPGIASYFNAESVELSQASFVVVAPRRASFNTAVITQAEQASILDEYELYIAESDTGLGVSERSELSSEGFASVFEYEVSGVGDDGRTQLSGVARVMFDSLNYVHIVEFVAVKAYYDANTSDIQQLLNSYEANQ